MVRRSLQIPEDWASRGATSVAIEVSAFPKASPERWLAIAKELRFPVVPSKYSGPSPNGWEASFQVGTASVTPFAPYVLGHVHPMKRDPTVAHWSLERRRTTRKSVPPEDHVSHESVEAFLGRLTSLWPHEPVEMDVSATFLVDEARWKHPFAGGRPVGRVARRLQVREIEWKVRPPSGVVQQVRWSRQEGSDVLTASAEVSRPMSTDMFDRLDSELWSGVCLLMEPEAVAAARKRRSKAS